MDDPFVEFFHKLRDKLCDEGNEFQKRCWMVDELLRFRRERFPGWGKGTCRGSNLIVFGNWPFVFVLHRQNLAGHDIITLAIFKNFTNVVNFSEHADHYDDRTSRRPIVDLYDVLTTGQPRQRLSIQDLTEDLSD